MSETFHTQKIFEIVTKINLACTTDICDSLTQTQTLTLIYITLTQFQDIDSRKLPLKYYLL